VSSGTDVSGTAIFTAINVSSATSVVIDVTNDSGGTPASYTFSAHCNGPR
jgi:hypothetical protein